jgi:hypothetical protein
LNKQLYLELCSASRGEKELPAILPLIVRAFKNLKANSRLPWSLKCRG